MCYVVAGGGELFQNNSEQTAFNWAFFAPLEPGIRGKQGGKRGFWELFRFVI
jgi:hypothetical protein